MSTKTWSLVAEIKTVWNVTEKMKAPSFVDSISLSVRTASSSGLMQKHTIWLRWIGAIVQYPHTRNNRICVRVKIVVSRSWEIHEQPCSRGVTALTYLLRKISSREKVKPQYKYHVSLHHTPAPRLGMAIKIGCHISSQTNNSLWHLSTLLAQAG